MAQQATGVRWSPETGEPRLYRQGRGIRLDGHADYEIIDGAGNVIATRKRAALGATGTIECVYPDDEL